MNLHPVTESDPVKRLAALEHKVERLAAKLRKKPPIPQKTRALPVATEDRIMLAETTRRFVAEAIRAAKKEIEAMRKQVRREAIREGKVNLKRLLVQTLKTRNATIRRLKSKVTRERRKAATARARAAMLRERVKKLELAKFQRRKYRKMVVEKRRAKMEERRRMPSRLKQFYDDCKNEHDSQTDP